MNYCRALVGVVSLMCVVESADAQNPILNSVAKSRMVRRPVFAWMAALLKEDFRLSDPAHGRFRCENGDGGGVEFSALNDYAIKRSIGAVDWDRGVPVYAVEAEGWFLWRQRTHRSQLKFDNNGKSFEVTHGQLVLRAGSSNRFPPVVYLSKGATGKIIGSVDGGWRHVEIKCRYYDYGPDGRVDGVGEGGFYDYAEREMAMPSSHVVRSRETMSGIAAAHRLPFSQVVAWNPQIPDPDKIRVGDIIYLQGRADAVPTPQYDPDTPSYTVRRGDSLLGIERAYGQRVDVLNSGVTNRNAIREGQILYFATDPNQSASAPEYYTVRRGDVASLIARKHQISLRELRRLNPGRNLDLIHPGTRLRLR